MEIQNRESDLIGPRRTLLKADPVPASAEQVSGRDQVAVAGRLELQPRAVPDESLQRSESLKIKSFWTFYLNLKV
jgi:hypothetical protein